MNVSIQQKMVVVGAFLIKDEKILLVLRQNTSSEDGWYGLVGGRVESGEAVHAALMREIEEEVGLRVRYEDMQLAHVISFKKDNGTELISFDFIIKTWEGTPLNKEPHKHARIDWFSIEQLPENILERHKKALELYQKGIYYTALY